MTTIRFLAKIAGVSHSTVSRALRDDPAIGSAMRERIQALAREYHYRPNQLLQGLLSGKSGLIGLVLPRVTFPYCARLLSGVLAHALDAECRILVQETHGDSAQTRYAIHRLVEQRVDGILLYTGHLEPLSRDLILELRSHDSVPVAIDATVSEVAIDSVRTDEMRLAELLVDYLVTLDHREIAYIGPQLRHHLMGRGLAVAQAMKKRLLPPAHLFDTHGKPYEEVDVAAIVQTLLAATPRPTAVITWEDHIAARVIEAVCQAGLRVPDDLSVLGCGNLPVGLFTTPRLTTIEQSPEQVGRQALELLLTRLHAPTPDAPVTTLTIAPQLIKRASCARRQGG
jgi:LacI family transcriptional regulator